MGGRQRRGRAEGTLRAASQLARRRNPVSVGPGTLLAGAAAAGPRGWHRLTGAGLLGTAVADPGVGLPRPCPSYPAPGRVGPRTAVPRTARDRRRRGARRVPGRRAGGGHRGGLAGGGG